jgi:hypothetical protein
MTLPFSADLCLISNQVVSITFFRYQGRQIWWALSQMQLAIKRLKPIQGLQFFKLLGSGNGNGFSIRPDFSTFCLVAAWENGEKAHAFLEHSPEMAQFRLHSMEQWTLVMQTAKSHGQWSGQNPFQPTTNLLPDEPIAVITRATIRTSRLWHFWQYVPQVSESLSDQEDLLFGKGIGELPLVQQATFSIWKNKQSMLNYAYRSVYHKEVVQKTRELGWYKEELFAQFKPIYSQGTWSGKNPLESIEVVRS